ncbi:MAG TPA: GAF domain-containing protein, partial [Polyangiales bacterium]
ASRGYGESGIGAEADIGKGLVGTVAATRKLMRVSGLSQDLRYGRAIRARVSDLGGDALLTPEIPLPGLANAASQLALPMLVGDELIGVVVFESESNLAMRLWHESFLQVLANQIAIGIDRLREQEDDEPELPPARPSLVPPGSKPRKFLFFRNDDCVFVDGEYLVRNVPGKILWKILNEHQRAQRTQFTNRELRLDPTLGLPAVKDNLESRLILLRKRLAEKCPEVKLVPTQRGRFALELTCPIELDERDHG